MDVCEALQRLHRRREADAIKQPSHHKNTNGGSSRTREVNSRYKSPTPSVSRRCTSPNLTRTPNAPTQLPPKRAISAERKRPSTPPTPSRPTTPVQDTPAAELQSRKPTTSSRLPESLWPSTMRSLSVSFQSDSYSIPVSKKEKPVTHALSDRTLKPSSNVAHKQAESTSMPRKPTPERRRSPLKGKNSSDQLENSRPVDGASSARARLIDQHRWPSRAGGKLSPNSMTKSMDLSDRAGKSSSIGVSSLRRLSNEGISRPLHKTMSDTGGVGQALVDEIGKTKTNLKALDDTVLKVSMIHKINLSKSSDSPNSVIAAIKSHSIPGSRLPSPSKASASRGMGSPSRTRPSTPTPTRGASPSRVRPSSPTRQMSSATSVLSFVSDLKKGKKINNQLEDAHQLRLLYNRYLQWRFANAQEDAALHIQKVLAEETLYNVWMATLELWDSVIMKRIDVQQLHLELKLNVVLNEQLVYLEHWALLERDHSTSLAGAIYDLESSTIRLPITAGARADNLSLKAAISSAADVMQAMTSSISSIHSKAEGTNCLVSEVAELAAQERAILDECEATLASTAAMQVEEYCLRAQLIQQLQGLRKNGQPVWAL